MFAFKLVANPIRGQCTSLTGWLLALGAIIILGWKFFTRTKRASLFGSFVSVKEKTFFNIDYRSTHTGSRTRHLDEEKWTTCLAQKFSSGRIWCQSHKTFLSLLLNGGTGSARVFVQKNFRHDYCLWYVVLLLER